jgi:uncharacterized protein with von Willebrand factor type A (vWA) domain
MSEQDPFVGLLVTFAGELRAAGLPVGSGDVLTYCAAMATLDPSDLLDLYWAGRATLLTRHESVPVYDEAFRRFFLGQDSPAAEVLSLRLPDDPESEATLVSPATDPGEKEDEHEEAMLGLLASNVETLKRRSFEACTPDELAAIRRIMARLRLTPPRRRTRRTAPAASGRTPDMRRVVRASLRTGAEPSELYWRDRRVRTRPLVLILDVSGSMAEYSRALLQFAYSANKAATKVEVFCFGTRLTRITRALDHRRPDQALEIAAGEVFDWDGGTRIGDSLQTFVRTWGRRGLCRGGIVVICSDGLDRGDPATLAAAIERLSRLSHRVVWLNPHKLDNADFTPSSLGMMVVAPHIDLLLSGHDLRSLEEFATVLPTLR